MGKLTDKTVANLQPGDKDIQVSDGGGLVLRVGRGSGRKEFFYRYRRTGENRSRWKRLGIYPALSLAAARIEAAKLELMRKTGTDPLEEDERIEAERLAAEEAERLAQAALISVRDLFERWASVDLIRRKDGGKEIRRMFEKDVLPEIGDIPVTEVRKGHVTGVTDALLARGVARMAKLIFSLMRQMFRFAVDRDIIEFDPTSSIRKAKIGGKDTERDRVLTEAEIKSLVTQLGAADLSKAAQCAVWLCLSTCCRIGELTAARWEHVDLDKGIWRIPPENSKNGRPHTVFLSEFAREKFEGMQEDGNPTWVFPARSGLAPLDPKTITKQIGDRQRRGQPPMKGRAKAELADKLELPGGRWTPHDLRRTGATLMVSLGVLPEVAERCLNHVEENRVKRVYQRHSYEREMHSAWSLLGQRLELLTRDDENVVTLERGNTAA